ncbi:DJ-1/PfpI family protein [Bacillus sp. LK2]|uniref:DJ-1/PfpI family protein n=1 Tax=Bacillus sp. LK2 TaxID=1628206 RepID=UPI0006534EC9|nr:DJ-1/PfpI family protein [Bacillus sp. LK2]KMN42047.1 thiamine biosynthesis protein ThiJ [Bacillus sp. LK2]
MQISIVIFDDFTDLDLFLPWDLLNRVSWDSVGKSKDWKVEIIGTKTSHISMSGLEIPTSGTLDKIPHSDVVIFTSGTGVSKLLNNEEYLNTIKLDVEKQLIGAMCSGTLLLGALGLLQNKTATTYPTRMKDLSKYGAIPVNKSFVVNQNIATAASCMAATELVNWIIKEKAGQEMVEKVMNSVEPISSTNKITSF